MTESTGSHGRKSGSQLALAIQAEREGVVFLEKVQGLATNPKVKVLMARLAKTKRQHLRVLEDSLKQASISMHEDEVRRAEVYPLADLQRIECYVCGHSIGHEAIPESCPRCGASRYAFEKDITLRRAWELAQSGMTATLRILAEAQKESGNRIGDILARQIDIERNLLNEMREEMEGFKEK